MKDNFPQIQELLHQRADYQARLNLLPYDGSPEIKESGGKRYLYIRKRIGSRLNSTYVDVYHRTAPAIPRTLRCAHIAHIEPGLQMTDLCHGAKVVPNGEKYKNRFDMKKGCQTRCSG